MSENHKFSNFVLFAGTMLIIMLFSIPAPAAENMSSGAAGLSREEALKVGERMYREGVLPSGGPMQAIVQGDIPVDSTMFSCVSCHLRSGLGSLEGRVITYPIDGMTLYKPISHSWNLRWVAGSRYAKAATGDLRSAYNDQTLAVAIRGGINPDGKTLNYTMPRYPLDDKDMEILIFYLKNLSIVPSPGVTDSGIRFAMVVTEEVSQADRQAMIGPLSTMASASKTGRSSAMAKLSLASDPDNLMNKGYVKVSVATWELKGPIESWRNQLEAYYKQEPVFALVGGISHKNWSPVHAFCEENGIPCILPITDLPVVSEADWFSIYFSKGFYQEGEAAAKYLNGLTGITQDVPIVQVYRENGQGIAMAKGFDETWTGLTGRTAEKRILSADEPVTNEFLKQLVSSHKQAVILLWLGPKDVSSISAIANAPDGPKMVFIPSILLGKELYGLLEKVRKFVYITYPYRLPADIQNYQSPPPALTDSNQSAAAADAIRTKANFVTMLASKSIFMMKGYFFRDRFLEVIDMMQDEKMTSLYPRLSFGPGQRYISKGCYIIQLGDGPAPKVVNASEWVVQ